MEVEEEIQVPILHDQLLEEHQEHELSDEEPWAGFHQEQQVLQVQYLDEFQDDHLADSKQNNIYTMKKILSLSVILSAFLWSQVTLAANFAPISCSNARVSNYSNSCDVCFDA